MIPTTSDGWTVSAPAWLREIGEQGDFGRRFVLDAPMLERITGRGFRSALDIGCGDGRFCRMMREVGIAPVGIDPTAPFIERARERDPEGDYRVGRAETLDIPLASFDLVVSYLSLVDIDDLAGALTRLVEVLRPGGTFLFANLTSFNTAGMPQGTISDTNGDARFFIDHYLEERAYWACWKGIRVRNWHRPLSTYMSLLLERGLELRHFAEPAATGGDPKKIERYRRAPYFHIMEWQKRGA